MITTDNASNLKGARELLVKIPGFTHILEGRCMMHAFALLLGSYCSIAWAKDLIIRVLKVMA